MVHNYLKGAKIKHVMYPKIPGNPDILLKRNNTVVYLDGCFWHGCPKCYSLPSSNVEYWKTKITRNKKNDAKNTRLLRRRGMKVLRLHECNIKKDFRGEISKIIASEAR